MPGSKAQSIDDLLEAEAKGGAQPRVAVPGQSKFAPVDSTPMERWSRDAGEAIANPRLEHEGQQDALNALPSAVTFGLDDQIAGVVAGIGSALKGGSFRQGYEQAQQARDASKQASAERSPWMTALGTGMGAAAQGAGLAQAGKAIGGAVGKGVQMMGGQAAAPEGAAMATRAATFAGNTALPAAAQAAGDANSLDAAPAGAGIGLAAGALGRLPGAARTALANPRVADWAERNAAKQRIKASGLEGNQLVEIEKRYPGGQRAFADRMEHHGIGGGWLPDPARSAEQAEEAASLLQAQREALVAQAGPVRIRSADNARAIVGKAREEFPARGADRTARSAMAAEAQQQARLGKKPPRPATDTASTAEFAAQDEAALAAPEALPQKAAPRRREVSLKQQSEEISAYNDRAFRENKRQEAERATVARLAAQGLNDEAEKALNAAEPGLGTQWRNNKRDQAMVMQVQQEASKTAAKSPVVRGLYRGGARGAAALGMGLAGAGMPGAGTALAAAGLVGEIAANPAVQFKAYRGLMNRSKAAAAFPQTALGRALARMPGNSLASATGRAGASLQAIQEAALRSPETAAKDHFLKSETDPEYNAAVNRPEE